MARGAGDAENAAAYVEHLCKEPKTLLSVMLTKFVQAVLQNARSIFAADTLRDCRVASLSISSPLKPYFVDG